MLYIFVGPGANLMILKNRRKDWQNNGVLTANCTEK
jgi:hypothetical protein